MDALQHLCQVESLLFLLSVCVCAVSTGQYVCAVRDTFHIWSSTDGRHLRRMHVTIPKHLMHDAKPTAAESNSAEQSHYSDPHQVRRNTILDRIYCHMTQYIWHYHTSINLMHDAKPTAAESNSAEQSHHSDSHQVHCNTKASLPIG